MPEPAPESGTTRGEYPCGFMFFVYVNVLTASPTVCAPAVSDSERAATATSETRTRLIDVRIKLTSRLFRRFRRFAGTAERPATGLGLSHMSNQPDPLPLSSAIPPPSVLQRQR